MFKMYIFFLFLMFICARASGIKNTGGVITSGVLDEEISQENVFEEAAESLSLLFLNINTTGLKEETVEDKDDCTGGLLDFIQCVVRAKIEHFREEFSKVAFPEKLPGAFQRHTFNSKVHGSLEKWFQEFNKHIRISDENCTSDNEVKNPNSPSK